MADADDELAAEKARLLARREALRARLEAIKQDIRQGLESDSEERATQLANAEVLEAIARSAAEELERVELRLARLL
jgi:RNA polymerase-binding transcription factor DksA